MYFRRARGSRKNSSRRALLGGPIAAAAAAASASARDERTDEIEHKMFTTDIHHPPDYYPTLGAQQRGASTPFVVGSRKILHSLSLSGGLVRYLWTGIDQFRTWFRKTTSF